MNRRIAVVRGLFGYAVIAGAEKTTGCQQLGVRPGCAQGRRLVGHLGTRRRRRVAGWCAGPRRLPGSLEADEVSASSATCAPAGTRRWPRRCWWAAASSRGPLVRRLTSTGGCPIPSGREGQQGTNGPGRSSVLRRAGQLPSDRTSAGVRHAGVFRGAAGTDTRIGVD